MPKKMPGGQTPQPQMPGTYPESADEPLLKIGLDLKGKKMLSQKISFLGAFKCFSATVSPLQSDTGGQPEQTRVVDGVQEPGVELTIPTTPPSSPLLRRKHYKVLATMIPMFSPSEPLFFKVKQSAPPAEVVITRQVIVPAKLPTVFELSPPKKPSTYAASSTRLRFILPNFVQKEMNRLCLLRLVGLGQPLFGMITTTRFQLPILLQYECPSSMMPTAEPTFPSILPTSPQKQLIHTQRNFITKNWNSSPFQAGRTSRGWTVLFAKFHLFSRLPKELRLMIWEAAKPEPRVIKFLMRLNLNWDPRSKARVPSMLHVNRESRLVALQWYELLFRSKYKANSLVYFDFHRDYLYLQCTHCYGVGLCTITCGLEQYGDWTNKRLNIVYECDDGDDPALFGLALHHSNLQNLLMVNSTKGLGSDHESLVSEFRKIEKNAGWQARHNLRTKWIDELLKLIRFHRLTPKELEDNMNALERFEWVTSLKRQAKRKLGDGSDEEYWARIRKDTREQAFEKVYDGSRNTPVAGYYNRRTSDKILVTARNPFPTVAQHKRERVPTYLFFRSFPSGTQVKRRSLFEEPEYFEMSKRRRVLLSTALDDSKTREDQHQVIREANFKKTLIHLASKYRRDKVNLALNDVRERKRLMELSDELILGFHLAEVMRSGSFPAMHELAFDFRLIFQSQGSIQRHEIVAALPAGGITIGDLASLFSPRVGDGKLTSKSEFIKLVKENAVLGPDKLLRKKIHSAD